METDNDVMVVGWREWLALPDLGVYKIKVKVDTGARTSAIHAFQVDPFERDGRTWVRFGLHPRQGDTDIVLWCEAEVIDERNVTDSGGHTERRYVIRTRLQMGGRTWPVEVTLTNRDNMLFRMLLGRTAMTAGNIIVNPTRSFLTGGVGDEHREAQRHEILDGETE